MANYKDRKTDMIEGAIMIVVMILLIWGVVQCADNIPRPSEQISRMKHKKGDIVYMKPDSTKAVIESVWEDHYTIVYMDKFGKRQIETWIEETEIY